MADALLSAANHQGTTPSFEPLDPETERALAQAWREGDRQAGRRLVEASLPFVVRIAREYRRWGIPLEDLVQQGNLGLLKAAAKYDPEKNCRLVTYAAYWIRAEIRDYVVRGYRIVRLGSTRTERRAMRTFRREGVDTPQELAERSGMPLSRAERLWPLLTQGDMPLDARYEGRSAPLERVRDARPGPEEEFGREDAMRTMRSAVADALQHLSERELRIVQARMLADEPRTLEQLGAEMGVSKERVRQLEERARRKLRSQLAELEPLAA
jgi:RNA polymerase sigma-32 factor